MLNDLKAYFTSKVDYSDDYYRQSENPLVTVLAINLSYSNFENTRIRTIEDIGLNCDDLADFSYCDIDTIIVHLCDYLTNFCSTNIVNEMLFDCVFQPEEYELVGDYTHLGQILQLDGDSPQCGVSFDPKYRVLENQVNHFIRSNVSVFVLDNMVSEATYDDEYEEFSSTAIYYEMIEFKTKSIARKYRRLYQKSHNFRDLIDAMGFCYRQGQFWVGVMYDLESYSPDNHYEFDALADIIKALRDELGYTQTHSLEPVATAFDGIIASCDGESYIIKKIIDDLLSTYESAEEVIL